MSENYVALAWLDDELLMQATLLRLTNLLSDQCIEICCTGRLATMLEDEIDYVIEQRGLLAITTTAIVDRMEAEEYASDVALIHHATVVRIPAAG